MNDELLRIVDAIRREKNIDAEIIFQGIESALVSAAKKHLGDSENIVITIDRPSGQISATINGSPMDPSTLGRIAAQTAKQVMIQKIREAERASLMQDYSGQLNTIISGQVTRIEHGNAIVTLTRGEGFLPRSEQIPGETLHVADRLRAIILEVREAGANIKIVLSRTHPDLIVRLFDLEVPEVADRVIQIEAIAREPGHRTKVAVSSTDSRVDAVGACVGIRGSRIKNIVEEVAGEKIDIVRYNESPQVFIGNSLKPAEVKEVLLNRDIIRATVLVADDQLSLAIGKKGQNVRLAARLTGWNIDILTPAEYEQQRSKALEQLAALPAVGEEAAQDLLAAGYISLADVVEVGAEPLARVTGMSLEQAQQILVEVSARMAELEVIEEARAAAAAQEAAAAEAAAAEATASEATAEAASEEASEEAAEEPREPLPSDLDGRPDKAASDIAVTDAGDRPAGQAGSDDNESPKA